MSKILEDYIQREFGGCYHSYYAHQYNKGIAEAEEKEYFETERLKNLYPSEFMTNEDHVRYTG